MENQSFFIEYVYRGKDELAEVKTCCETDSIYYYDIIMKNTYQFTITPVFDDENGLTWKISLKNADKQVDPELIEILGREIEKNLLV
jgi:hypothetical protein